MYRIVFLNQNFTAVRRKLIVKTAIFLVSNDSYRLWLGPIYVRYREVVTGAQNNVSTIT